MDPALGMSPPTLFERRLDRAVRRGRAGDECGNEGIEAVVAADDRGPHVRRQQQPATGLGFELADDGLTASMRQLRLVRPPAL
jgi:hypothetical protein